VESEEWLKESCWKSSEEGGTAGGRNGYDVELWLHPDIVQMPMTRGQNANNF
jgi:hypothetical protein